MAFGTVKQWRDDDGWGVVVSPEVPGEVWGHFSHIIDDDEHAYRSLKDGERVRFGYERYPPGQDGYFWRITWVVTAADPEYAALTDDEIVDRARQIDERRAVRPDDGTYVITETIEVVEAPLRSEDAPPPKQ